MQKVTKFLATIKRTVDFHRRFSIIIIQHLVLSSHLTLVGKTSQKVKSSIVYHSNFLPISRITKRRPPHYNPHLFGCASNSSRFIVPDIA